MRVWSTETLALLYEVNTHAAAVSAVCWCPYNGTWVTAASDDILRVWKANKQQSTIRTQGDNGINTLFIDCARKVLLAAGRGRSIHILSLENGQELGCLLGHTDQVRAVVLLEERKQYVSVAWDCTMRFWSANRQPAASGPGAPQSRADKMLLSAANVQVHGETDIVGEFEKLHPLVRRGRAPGFPGRLGSALRCWRCVETGSWKLCVPSEKLTHNRACAFLSPCCAAADPAEAADGAVGRGEAAAEAAREGPQAGGGGAAGGASRAALGDGAREAARGGGGARGPVIFFLACRCPVHDNYSRPLTLVGLWSCKLSDEAGGDASRGEVRQRAGGEEGHAGAARARLREQAPVGGRHEPGVEAWCSGRRTSYPGLQLLLLVADDWNGEESAEKAL